METIGPTGPWAFEHECCSGLPYARHTTWDSRKSVDHPIKAVAWLLVVPTATREHHRSYPLLPKGMNRDISSKLCTKAASSFFLSLK